MRAEPVLLVADEAARRRENVMGREARVGLLLGAAACLLAVMVDWIIEELNED